MIPYGTRVPAAVRLVANCYTPFTLPLPLHLPVKPLGHVAVADQAEDDSRALRASLNPPGNWRRPRGRPRQTWLPTISDDLQHLNLGLSSSAGSSFMAEDRGNSCVHVVGAPPDDDNVYIRCLSVPDRNPNLTIILTRGRCPRGGKCLVAGPAAGLLVE